MIGEDEDLGLIGNQLCDILNKPLNFVIRLLEDKHSLHYVLVRECT